jgi:hypothetical protein
MTYTNEAGVYEATGMNTTIVQNLGKKSESEVTTMIGNYIAEAQKMIQRKLGVPIKIRKEEHLGDGRTNNIELGPWEDSIGMNDYDPSDVVQNVYAIFVNGRRRRLPYPKDCDELTEGNSSSYTGSNATLSDETTIIKCGSYSVKCIFSAAGYMSLVLSGERNIHPWDYIGFWFYSTSTSVTFTLRLYDRDGNYNYKTFTCPVANRFCFIRLNIDEFTGSIDWSDTDLYSFAIYADGACTTYLDNFNFNDGWWWTYPEGLINYGEISGGQGWVPEGSFIEVTYDYDPYLSDVPEDVERACKCFAGAKLLTFLIGCRLRDTGFEVSAEDMDIKTDKATLESDRARLIAEGNQIMVDIGMRTYTGFA